MPANSGIQRFLLLPNLLKPLDSSFTAGQLRCSRAPSARSRWNDEPGKFALKQVPLEPNLGLACEQQSIASFAVFAFFASFAAQGLFAVFNWRLFAHAPCSFSAPRSE